MRMRTRRHGENLLERLTAAQETVEQQRDEESRAAIFWALGRDNEQEGSEPWRPPGDGAPATRKHAAMPNLEVTANGDLIVTDTSAAAYSANTEPDDEVRLSAAYARSLPAGVALLFLAPNGFDSGRQRSLKHRWQTAHTYISSIQADCLKRYSLAVSRWLAFAEESGVPPAERFPANSHALVDWIADLVCDKQFSKSYVSQHVDGLRFWHNLHLVPWDLDDAVRRQLMKGARVLAPPPADPRRGATVEDLQAVADVLLEEARAAPAELPKALAFMAAQSFAFFAIARIKDVTVGRQNDAKVTGRRLRPDESQTLRAFDPKYDASGANVTIYEESEELPPLVKIHLPWDKINKEKGVDIRAAEQSTLGKRLDPVSCMRKHLEANHPSAADPAFSYIGRNGKSRVKLTVGFFRKEVNRCLAARSRPPLAMHGFRIGGNNFYKMCKIDSQIIRSHGRRKSTDSYQLYQRELDEVARRVTANLSLPKGSQGADSRDQDSDWDSFDDDADNEE